MSNFSSYMGYKTKNSPQKWFLTVLNHLPVNKLPLWEKNNFSHRFLFLGSIIKKSLKSSIFFADGKDPEGPPYLQYEQVVPTRESNALIGGLLTVDENRADIPSITERTDSDPDFLEVDGIGLFGDDFSKKIQDEITSEKINQFPTGNV